MSISLTGFLFFAEGFQLLHAVYAVEHFLQGLVQRKCTFHIVFFDEHEEACIPRNAARLNRNKYLLARSVIIRHLQAHLPKAHPSISLQVFKSVEDPSFGNYLKTSAVYFMLCHDGADSTIITGGTPIPDEDRTEKARVEAEERSRKLLFRGLIYSMIRKGYNVALINGLEWMDTKVGPRPHLSEEPINSIYLGDDNGRRRSSPITTQGFDNSRNRKSPKLNYAQRCRRSLRKTRI